MEEGYQSFFQRFGSSGHIRPQGWINSGLCGGKNTMSEVKISVFRGGKIRHQFTCVKTANFIDALASTMNSLFIL